VVLTGRIRRRWTAAEKGRIVAEAVGPGAIIAEVARRHDLTPQHLSNWIRAAKAGRLVLPALDDAAGIGFVPVVAEEPRAARPGAMAAAVEIVIGPVVVRIRAGADAAMLESVVRAVKRA
jgi:transposase